MKRVLSSWNILLFLLVFGFVPLDHARAEGNISINLRLETVDQTVLDMAITVPETCEIMDSTGATSTHIGYAAICALESAKQQELLTYQVTDWLFALAIDSINDMVNATDWSQTWLIYHNFLDPGVGINGFTLAQGDKLLLTYGPWPMEPLHVELTASSTEIDNPVTLTAQVWNGGNLTTYEGETTFWIDGTPHVSDSGTFEYIPQTEGEIEIYVEASGKTRSEKTHLTVLPKEENPQAVSNHVIIDYLGENVFEGDVLTTSTWFYDSAEKLYANTSTVSALGVLSQSSRQGEFPINITSSSGYYVSSINNHSAEGFDGWIYNINGEDPGWVAMNDYNIQDGDLLTVFYSLWPWKIESDVASTTVGESVLFTAHNYSEGAWHTSPSTTISIDGELFVTDELGTYSYTTTATGTIAAFIYGDEIYPPNSPAISVQILSAASGDGNQDGNNNTGGGNSGGGGGSGSSQEQYLATNAEINGTVEKILNYLKSEQGNDGKIIDGGITDWIIMSFGANGQYADDITTDDTSLLDFAQNYRFTDPSEINLCASYPRHIMALLAAGVAKNNTQIENLKTKIIGQECYKENLYGGQNGINDDIFALVTLLALEYDKTENIISDMVATILADQTQDGAFTWAGSAGADITGGAVNALKYAQSKGININQEVFNKAKNYLKQNQLSDGGWGFNSSDVLTTSWAIMGINALGETQQNWISNEGYTPWSPLVSNLNDEGYYELVSGAIDPFAMKHAVPALLGSSWPVILSSRTQNNINPGNAVGSPQSGDITNPTPTSTPAITDITTSTEPTFEIVETPTSTPEIIMDIAETNEENINEMIDTQPVENLVQTTPPQILGTRISEEENTQVELDENTDNETSATDESEKDSIDKNTETGEKIEQTPSQRNATIVLYSALGAALILGGWIIWKFIKSLL